jgi:hypothetical protein
MASSRSTLSDSSVEDAPGPLQGPVASCQLRPGFLGASAAAQPWPAARQQLDVSLVSPAFALSPESARDWVARCAIRLGVGTQRLRFLAATEVCGPEALPPGCGRVLVEVADSGEMLVARHAACPEPGRRCAISRRAFPLRAGRLPRRAAGLSLRALEELLRENDRLRGEGGGGSSPLAGACCGRAGWRGGVGVGGRSLPWPLALGSRLVAALPCRAEQRSTSAAPSLPAPHDALLQSAETRRDCAGR